jgi:hypothetical protein
MVKEPHVATGTNFCCNLGAFSPDERTSHLVSTDRLIAARTSAVETANGYEFQFSPTTISIAELGQWAVAESKCCPFFDFHIDLEDQGRVLRLRLTGAEGIKAFIRAEFQVPSG